uniref:isochorismatase family protein n=1 Tax=Microbulbifer agarilyticus TaxID=260552 RepID=UPI000255B4B7|nr:isochorismatase family protein [Microbulbifer agarilyticus]
MIKSVNPILVIIDVQDAIDTYGSSERSNAQAENKIAQLLGRWRAREFPIIHVRHSSKYEDSPYHQSSDGFRFKKAVAPLSGEIVVTKSENCAFINTDLEYHIKSFDATELVVCGVLVNNSIDATIRVAAGLGYSVFLPEDATAAFGITGLNGKNYPADDVHWLYLSNLDGEYCKVITTANALSV